MSGAFELERVVHPTQLYHGKDAGYSLTGRSDGSVLPTMTIYEVLEVLVAFLV